MNRKFLGLALFFVGTTLVACGGGGPTYVDASMSTDTKPDTVTPKDAGTDSLPPPMASATSKLIAPAGAKLVGSGPESCTNQDPAPGDRWCAFTLPGRTLGFNDLWVINVTKAAAAATTPNAPAVKCDTTDANCLRLSTGLYEDVDLGFTLHGFDGDTLIYYEEPSHADGTFVGVVRAWRPGWTGGRKLTSTSGVVCAGSKTSAAALCFDNVVTNSANTLRTADLHVGVLTDQAGGLLPKVDTLLIAAKDDAEGVRKWRADVSPDGTRVAWSTRADATGPEVLRVQTIGNDASRAVVAEDVSQWIIGPDGQSWFWLKKYNYDQLGAPAGTLETAPFPAGTNPTVLAAAVGEYDVAGGKGVVYRANMKDDVGDLIIMPDRATPATVVTLDQQVLFVFDHSKDGTKVAYTKNAESLSAGLSSAPIFDLYVAANDGKRPCAMAASPIAFLAPDFLDSGDYSAWGRLNSVTTEIEGVYTTLATCTTKKFATEVFSWTPIGSEGYVFLDELFLDPDRPDINEATLRYSKLDNGALPARGTSIQTRAQFTYAPLLPTLAAVVYEVKAGTSADGLYINASLPFTTKPVVPPPDGGAPDVIVTPEAGTDAGVEAGDAQDAPAEVGGVDAAPDLAPDAAVDADPDAG
jgi:hypothetical protein